MNQVSKAPGSNVEVSSIGEDTEFPLLRSSLFNINPFGLMRQFTEDLNRMVGATEYTTNGSPWLPTIEMKRSNGNLLVSVELPGVKKGDVKVTIQDDRLCIEGERKESKDEKGTDFFRTERRYGKFYRALPLPEGVKVESVNARFVDGVLEIKIPVPAASAKVREIPIEDSSKAKSTAG